MEKISIKNKKHVILQSSKELLKELKDTEPGYADVVSGSFRMTRTRIIFQPAGYEEASMFIPNRRRSILKLDDILSAYSGIVTPVIEGDDFLLEYMEAKLEAMADVKIQAIFSQTETDWPKFELLKPSI